MSCCRILVILVLTSIVYSNAFALNKLKGIRLWPSPDSTRVVFDLEDSPKYKVFNLNNPNRIVIDLDKTLVNAELKSLNLTDTRIKKVRIGKHKDNLLRIVLELQEHLTPNSFALKPSEPYGNRLVVDLDVSNLEKEKILALFDLDNIKTGSNATRDNKTLTLKPKPQDFIVAIDCGHGGEDPGAIGRYGTKEKDVVLSIGRELKNLLNTQPGIRSFLVRNGDYYVGLRQRVMIARNKKADLFVSVHADSFTNSKANGASVFVVSRRGASSEAARWLAKKENNADLVGGINLAGKNNFLARVLLDMSQQAASVDSLGAARNVLKNMGQISTLHKSNIERAGFAVLKAPDVPSILIETGFISNPSTEKKLRTKLYQQKIARAISQGIKEHFATKTNLFI